MSVQIFCTSFKLNYLFLIKLESTLYFVDTNLLSDICFGNIFSHSVACLYILLAVPSEERKFLILVKSHSSTCSFMDCTFGVISVESLLQPRPRNIFSYVFF